MNKSVDKPGGVPMIRSGVKALRLLGLSQKAGELKSGSALAIEAIRGRKAALAMLAQDASEGTKKVLQDKCRSYAVPLIVLPFTKEELGRAIGKGERSALALVSKGLAESLIKALEENTEEVEYSGKD